jgi:hypothetical protein
MNIIISLLVPTNYNKLMDNFFIIETKGETSEKEGDRQLLEGYCLPKK